MISEGFTTTTESTSVHHDLWETASEIITAAIFANETVFQLTTSDFKPAVMLNTLSPTSTALEFKLQLLFM